MAENIKEYVRLLVGGELGYNEEGCIQWYYTMSMVISGLLIWKSNSDIGLIFMLLSLIHFVTLYIYGATFNAEKSGKLGSVIFLITHLIIIIIALIIDPAITFLSVIFTLFMICVASIMAVFAVLRQDCYLPVIINFTVFAAFLTSVIILPIKWYEKIIFIVMELVIHPVIDFLQEYIPPVTEVVNMAWKKAFK